MANKSVRNEQRKLTATFLNGVAIAAVAVGGFTQVATMTRDGQVTANASAFTIVCLAGAILLHLVARASLSGIEE